MWLQEIPFRHIWNGTQNGLHCSFSLEQVDRSETQLTCNILVAQSEMSANQQIIHISRNVAQVPLSLHYLYSTPDRRAECCDERVCLSVCVHICLPAIISSELHLRYSPICICMLPMAVARSYSGSVVIRYVLPVYGNVIFARKPRLLDVAAQLKRSARAALGLAVSCAQ